MKEKAKSLPDRLKAAYTQDPLFHENEIQANKMMRLVLFISGLVMLAVWIGDELELFQFARDLVDRVLIIGLADIILLCLVSLARRDDAWWLKYLLLGGSALVFARMDAMFTHKAELLIVFPVICSSRYFSRRLTVGVALVTTVLFAISAAFGANHGLLNLNDLTLPTGTTLVTTDRYIDGAVWATGYDKGLFLRNVMLYSYLPKWLIFCVVTVISALIAKRGRDMVMAQKRMTEKNARIDTELNLATRIQAGMLPSRFPAFPDRRDVDLYAVMDPAKEVGGDFYDYFLIDDDHLGLVIADVSGKGVPAALFMMTSMVLMRNDAMTGLQPAAILETVNRQICKYNREQMFVSVWLGILDLKTGRLTAVNAGHEYPMIRQPGGAFELFRDKHGLVAGAMDGVPYTAYELVLEPGAKLFVYTDGLPEAITADKEAFGLERTLSALNEAPDASPEAILKNIRTAVDRFVGRAEQFDDLTMMCVQYNGQNRQEEDRL